MSWQAIVALRLVVAYVIAQPLVKLMTRPESGAASRTQKFLLQFLLCLAGVSVFVVVSGGVVCDWRSRTMFAFGLVNALAAFCQWKSIAHSLSKNSLFTSFDDIVAIGLSYFILHEANLVNGWVYLGIAFSFSAFLLFAVIEWRGRKSGVAVDRTPISFFVCVLIYSVIWGLAGFLMRYFGGIHEMPAASFLASWYAGTTVGAIAIFLLGVEVDEKASAPLTRRDIGTTMVLACSTLGALALAYRASSLAPQTVVQPIYLVAEMILPTLIGLSFFKEKKDLGLVGWCSFALGMIGGLLIFFKDVLPSMG